MVLKQVGGGHWRQCGLSRARALDQLSCVSLSVFIAIILGKCKVRIKLRIVSSLLMEAA